MPDRSGRGFFDGSIVDGDGNSLSLDALFVSVCDTTRAVFAAGELAPTGGIDRLGSNIASIGDDEVSFSPDGDVLAKVTLAGGFFGGIALLTARSGGAGLRHSLDRY